MRRSSTALLLLALCLGAATARELQGTQVLAAKAQIATNALQATGEIVGGALETKAEVVGDTLAAKHALISGIRAVHAAKVSALRQHFYGDAGMTPTATPAECLSVAEVAKKAGNFSVLLAAAEVRGRCVWWGWW